MKAWTRFSDLMTTLQLDDAPAGGALVIYHHGEQVVATAVGQAMADMPWRTDTLSVNFSIGKGVMATLMAVLVSQRLLDYDAPIAQYWAEFGANGKAAITLRQVLTHTAGLFNIAAIADDNDALLDFSAMTAKVAAMPVDTPVGQDVHGYASAYSGLVSGWILGALVERVTGMSLQAALDAYLAQPLSLVGQLYYGLPADKLSQVAKPVCYFDGAPSGPRKPVLKPDSERTLASLAGLPSASLWQDKLGDATLSTAHINKLYFDTSVMNMTNYKNALMPNGKDSVEYHRDDVLSATIPAANGVSTAQALATIYAMHAAGGVWQGERLIAPEVMSDIRWVQTDGMDAVMPANMRWRTGFHRLFTVAHAPHAYGHMGYNGSVAFCDPKRALAVAFIHNYDTTMLNDVRQFAISELALQLAQSV